MKRLVMSLLSVMFCPAGVIAQIDTKATPETAALYRNLKDFPSNILFSAISMQLSTGTAGRAIRSGRM
jgi:mannan endo-1,4-beta-mannosidase